MDIGTLAHIAIEGIKLGHHVSEVYSPPRVTQQAGRCNLKAGWSFDLTQNDPSDNKPWDFNVQSKRERAKQIIEVEKPFLLIGSPPCTPFSVLFANNVNRMNPDIVRKKIKEGLAHLKFCIEL